MTYNRTSFDDPFEASHVGVENAGPYVDPMMVLGLIFGLVLLGCLAYAAWAFGRRQGRKKVQSDMQASALSIYEGVEYHLEKALTAPGSLILERARALADIIEARLGLVMAVDARYGKLSEALKKALAGPVEVTPEAVAKTKVAMSAEEQRIKVWEALQGLHQFWQDRDAVLRLIRKAQDELVQIIADKPLTSLTTPLSRVVKERKPKAETTPKPPRKKADVEPMPVVPTEIVLPPEKPPRAPRVSKKKLARHKKNMLA